MMLKFSTPSESMQKALAHTHSKIQLGCCLQSTAQHTLQGKVSLLNLHVLISVKMI